MFCSKKKKAKLSKELANATHDDIKSLKKQVEELLNSRVTPAIVDVADKADKVMHNTKEITDVQVQQVSGKVRSKPLAAIIISIAVGFLLGRIVR